MRITLHSLGSRTDHHYHSNPINLRTASYVARFAGAIEPQSPSDAPYHCIACAHRSAKAACETYPIHLSHPLTLTSTPWSLGHREMRHIGATPTMSTSEPA